MLGEDVDERERVVRVLTGEERVEDTHKDVNLRDSLGAVRMSLCADGYNAVLKKQKHTTKQKLTN